MDLNLKTKVLIKDSLLSMGRYLYRNRERLEIRDKQALFRCGNVARAMFKALTDLPLVHRRGMNYVCPSVDPSAYSSFRNLREAAEALHVQSKAYVLMYSIDSFKGLGGFGDHHAVVVIAGDSAYVLQSYFPDVALQYTRFERSAFLRDLGNISGMWDTARSLPAYKGISAMGPRALAQLESIQDCCTGMHVVAHACVVPVPSVSALHVNVARFVKQDGRDLEQVVAG
jgi:hypothetical protein